MKVSSLIFTLTLLNGNTGALSEDVEAAVHVDSAVPVSTLQANTTQTPSSSVFESIWAKVLPGINTECKTCPNSLCTNKNFYGSLMMFRATCWTAGQKINATDTWLQSEEGCYITVQDTLKYSRNYTEDLKPCHNVTNAPNSRKMSAKAVAECKRCPNDKCEVMRTYERRSEIAIICRAQALPGCLEDCLSSDIPPVNLTTVFPWMKSSANCYIKSTSLQTTWQKRQLRQLEDCGPVPYLDYSYRAAPPTEPLTVTMTATSIATMTVWYPNPTTTTVIVHPNPCAGPDCPPLIWGYTPPAAIPNSTALVGPTSTGGVSLLPLQIAPNTTVPPNFTPIATLTPMSLSGTSIPNAPVTDPQVATNMTLAPVTFAMAQTTDPSP